MNKILRKRFPRELKAHFFRYLALFAMTVLCMYIIISLVDSAEIIIKGTAKNQEECALEDGQFTVYTDFTKEEIQKIEDKGVTLEAHISYDVSLKDGTTLRIFKNREKIDRVTPDEGRLAESEKEIVLEKRYCEENDYHVGDEIKIGDIAYKITGIGSSVDYDAPFRKLSDTAIESRIFGTAFVSEDGYERIKSISSAGSEDITYAFILNDALTDDEFKETIKEIFSERAPIGLTAFLLSKDNVRVGGAAGDIVINKSVGLFAGVVVMVLFTYVLSVFVIHQIQNESSVIGTFYAMGVKKRSILGHYVTIPTLLSFAGGVVGALLGFSNFGTDFQTGDSYGYYSLPEFEKVVPPYLIVYAVLMPPLVSLAVNLFVLNKRLSRTALSLIRNEQNVKKTGNVVLKNMKFMRMFKIRQILREKRTALTVFAGMTIGLLIFIMGFDCYTLCDNVGKMTLADTKYEYLYTYKYPTPEVPEGGVACFGKSLKKEKDGYTLDVNILGIDKENPFLDVDPVKGKNKIVASDAVAVRYGLKKGDKLILSDTAEDMDYAFTVSDIVPYSVGLTVFMDINSMRELFGKEDDYYNVVMSDKRLDIDEERLYSTSTRADTERATGIFVDLMRPMFVMLIVMSGVIFFIIMYLMTSVMIDRGSFGISLFKIFGFKSKEVKRMYLDGNRLTVAVGALVAIPVAKIFIDSIFPKFIPNVACCIHLEYEWYWYVVIFAGIMVIYEFISLAVTGKLNRITPAEVLKNRE
ncbi:MAG: hypothetical protein K5796_01110 [Lachnospiraceae bacterium]|nr:hypothetical protein [Lachnospiraceae bacterium]